MTGLEPVAQGGPIQGFENEALFDESGNRPTISDGFD